MRLQNYLTEEFELPHISGNSKLKTDIRPEERSFKNLPRDGKGKSKVKFQDWLGIKSNGSKGTDGKYYGWSHRAVAGFKVGDTVKKGDVVYQGKEYTIDSDEQAQQVAKQFANEVS